MFDELLEAIRCEVAFFYRPVPKCRERFWFVAHYGDWK